MFVLIFLYFSSNGKMLMLTLESNYKLKKKCVVFLSFSLIAPSNLFSTLFASHLKESCATFGRLVRGGGSKGVAHQIKVR